MYCVVYALAALSCTPFQLNSYNNYQQFVM